MIYRLSVMAAASIVVFACSSQGNSNPQPVQSSSTNLPRPQSSGQVQQVQTNDKLHVLAVGYGRNTAQTTVGLLLQNPSQTLAALGITIQVTGRDATGSVVGTSDAALYR
jgi:hypothetical protein